MRPQVRRVRTVADSHPRNHHQEAGMPRLRRTPSRESRIIVRTTTGRRLSRRVLRLVAAVSLATGGLFAVGVAPAFADTTLCSGASYSTCTVAGYTDHGFGAH